MRLAPLLGEDFSGTLAQVARFQALEMFRVSGILSGRVSFCAALSGQLPQVRQECHPQGVGVLGILGILGTLGVLRRLISPRASYTILL
jgi:hypothetical protein